MKRNSQSEKDVIDKSSKIFKILIEFPKYISAKNILLYCSKEKEVQTEKIIKLALAKGKKVIVPITNKEKKVLEFSEIIDYDNDLEISTFNIPEPKKDRRRPFNMNEIDLIIVPGVGFDPDGTRLGYGFGYYDKFLNTIKNKATIIGLAFEIQIVSSLPANSNDIRMNKIITEDRIIDCQ